MEKLLIGTWREESPREIVQGTEYAADTIIHEVIPGEYPVYALVSMGKNQVHDVMIADIADVVVTVDTNIVGGTVYNGFGGLQMSSRKVSQEPATHILRFRYYNIPEMVQTRLTLFAEYSWLDNPYWLDFATYIEVVRVALHRHYGLDPYWMLHSVNWMERLVKLVDAVNDNDTWSGYDITCIKTAMNLNIIRPSSRPGERLTFTYEGERFIESIGL